jgi:two-component system, NarL family, sensor kinase
MMTAPGTPLLTTLEQLAPPDHLCSIYESPEEHFAVAIPFIRIGLDRGEKCIYIADDGTEAIVRDAMYAGGIDVERAIATDGLVLEKKEAAYLKHGSFDPEWMFTFWTDATAEAMRQGFSSLRVTGETEWVVRGAPGLERWMEYESRVTHTLARHNCVVLCQYNRRLFPAELVLDVIRTHPTVIYRGVVCRNMYYVPPDELLGTNQAAREVERLLTNIREREEVESTLRLQRNELRESEARFRESERLLRLVLDALPVGVAVVDRSGDIILSNPASQRIWSGSIRSGRERYAESKAWWHESGARLVPQEWASKRALNTGETSVNEVIEIEAFDGARKIIQNSAVPIRDSNEQITGAVIVNEDVSARKTAEHELNDSYNQLRTLTGRLMRAQDDERRRIAQLLHETTAQNLAGLKMHLARLNRTAGQVSDADRDTLAESVSLVDQSISEIRTLSYLLHPPFLDEMGLLSALRWYAGGFSERSGIAVNLELPESFERLPLDTETALFRIVQESLINIHRHAASETARIGLRRDAETLVLEIEDRGHGIPKDSLAHIMRREGLAGVGIAGMSERIEQLGGRLEITSSDQGTTVRVLLPLVKDPS